MGFARQLEKLFSVRPHQWFCSVGQMHRPILRQLQDDAVPCDFQLGVNLMGTTSAKPDVLGFALLSTSFIAEVNIETEELAFILYTDR
jgi:hypothetical protein